MNATSSFMYAIILINLSGTVSYLSWRRLYPYLTKYASNLVYITLRQTCLFCMAPVGYVMVRLLRRNGYIQGDDWWRMNFRVTGTVGGVLTVLWLVWTIRTACSVVKEIKKHLPQKEERNMSFPEEEGTALEEFRAAKKELKIRGFVGLYRDKRIRSPRTTGALFAKVVLPYLYGYEYSEEQLRVIYYHELTHYRFGDVFYKVCSLLASRQGMFRFLTRERNYMLAEWSERNCDIGAIAALEGKMTGGDYFRVILEMMEQQSEIFGEGESAASMLYDGSSRLERRIEYVRNYKETTKTSKGIMALFLASFLTVNVASSYVTGCLLASLNDVFYQATEKVSVEKSVQDDLEEIFLYGTGDVTYTKMECLKNTPIFQSVGKGEAVKEFWSIAPEIRHISGKLFLEQGQCVSISCTTVPSTETIWIGLMNNSDNDVMYVKGEIAVGYVFTVPQDGDYCVFVQNCGDHDIMADVTYQYE